MLNLKKLINHEIYKILKNIKNLILITCLFLMILIMIGLNWKKGTTYMMKTGNIYMDNASYSESMAASLQAILENDPSYEEKEPLTKQIIELYTALSKNQRNAGFFYTKDQEKDYSFINSSQLRIYNALLDGLENGIITEEEISERGYTLYELIQLSAYSRYLEDSDGQLMLNKYTINGATGMVLFFESSYTFILIILMSFLMMDVYLREVTDGSYKLILTQPRDRYQLFLAKALAMIIFSILLIILLTALNFLVCTVIGGLGNWSYPMMSRQSLLGFSANSMDTSILILPVWEYVLRGLIMLVTINLLTISFILYISIRTDSNNTTISSIVILLFIAFAFGSFIPRESILNLFYPYSYLFINKVLSVANRSNYLTGITISIGLCAILFIYSYKIFIKKDFLGAVD